ncbi:winged helix-turn-helix transcriptional regulator [Luteipulveratus mongoliensis]|uniref:Transcriptional regulator n=1 Tax=Luteipulveratus mongoliensis TaxID=571913 RepID=A0A0K1JGH7_9MICO|nr:winged helix-turn-helix transcriptional regulator [Luteipulveratus mongoliensis]AKU15809.1 transcriptional regulator [Luteipulveratus mongoliensis]
MATHRSYDDSCGMAHALDLVGERWSLLVVRELMLGPQRFTDLKDALPGISRNVLTDRLSELAESGILMRTQLAPPAASKVYELTEWGYELEPIIKAIGRWGARSPQHRPDLHLSVSSAVLSLRTNFDAGASGGVDASYGLVLDQDHFAIWISDQELDIQRGDPDSPSATLTTDPMTLAGMLYGGLPLTDAERGGQVTIDGNRAAVRRLVGLFTLPEKAAVPA